MEDWSNEKMKESGAGRRTMADGTGLVLDAPTAALVRVAAALARGKRPSSRRDSRRRATRESRAFGSRSYCCRACSSWVIHWRSWRSPRGVGWWPAPVAAGAEGLAHADWESWAARGETVCREVYGRAYHKLLVNLRALHPALEHLYWSMRTAK